MEEENPKWSTSKVAPYVVRLPLPPDYYLKELRELLANYANELEQDENSFDDDTWNIRKMKFEEEVEEEEEDGIWSSVFM